MSLLKRLEWVDFNILKLSFMQPASTPPHDPLLNFLFSAAAGWAKFHGRNSGRSVSVLLHPDDAAAVRGRRRGEERGEGELQGSRVDDRTEEPEEDRLKNRLEEVKVRGEERVTDQEVDEEGTPPPLPPKPRQKISVMGSPNTEHFIVMDNSALFSARQRREGEEREEKSEKKGEEKTALQESHSRSDSGLSSLSSWTAVSKSGCSSVRSSSIVSDCSSKIEELLEEEVGAKTFLSTCSLKLENLIEHDEMIEKQEAGEEKEDEEEEEYDDVCQSSSAEASSIGSHTNNVTQDYISYPNKRSGYGKSLNYGANSSHLRNLSCQQ